MIIYYRLLVLKNVGHIDNDKIMIGDHVQICIV